MVSASRTRRSLFFLVIALWVGYLLARYSRATDGDSSLVTKMLKSSFSKLRVNSRAHAGGSDADAKLPDADSEAQQASNEDVAEDAESQKLMSSLTGRAEGNKRSGKPWPSLEGYPPWHPPTHASSSSCEAVFGNGFAEIVQLFGTSPPGLFDASSASGGPSANPDTDADFIKCGPGVTDVNSASAVDPSSSSWLRCLKNDALGTSICESHNLIFHPDRVDMASGGEDLESVMGRAEEVELPRIREGAFEVVGECRKGADGWSEDGLRSVGATNEAATGLFPEAKTSGCQHWRPMVTGLKERREAPKCATVFRQPMLMVIRYEYVNMYHTNTDWQMAYQTSRVAGLQERPGVIFLDGHAKGNLDLAWGVVFDGIHFAKHLAGPVCFSHLIFVPLGYVAAQFQALGSKLGVQRGCMGGFPKSLDAALGGSHVGSEQQFGSEATKADKVAARDRSLVIGEPRLSASADERMFTPRTLEYGEAFARSFGIGVGAMSYRSMFEKQGGQARRWVDGQSDDDVRAANEDSNKKRAMRVLFVRREHFIAHPRNRAGPQTRLNNEEHVVTKLREWAAQRSGVANYQTMEQEEKATRDKFGFSKLRKEETTRVRPQDDAAKSDGTRGTQARKSRRRSKLHNNRNEGEGRDMAQVFSQRRLLRDGPEDPPSRDVVYILNGTLAHWRLDEQIEAAYNADVWVGVHGAGLTHLQFARPGTRVVEIQARESTYQILSHFRGLPYESLGWGDDVDPQVIIDVLDKYATNFFA
eukprot:TRINITY_DN13373_c0_g2_i1.p1 TRINITY_DN13373_c0_g2~~TRINITY_DN13373_c0_g2_i1.p1  ORF type:complete len:758 (+),score=67.38 TRINITY_DN13373_c0_g2_i1:837-3110(+)